MPRAAIAARSRSVSNHSATRSADRHRHPAKQAVTVLPARAPGTAARLQQLPQLAAPTGRRCDGGVISSRPARSPPTLRERLAELRILRAHRAAENAEIASAVRAGSRREHQRPAVRRQARQPRVGRDELHAAPLELHVARRSSAGAARACASVGAWKPGANSSVTPRRRRRSRRLEHERAAGRPSPGRTPQSARCGRRR